MTETARGPHDISESQDGRLGAAEDSAGGSQTAELALQCERIARAVRDLAWLRIQRLRARLRRGIAAAALGAWAVVAAVAAAVVGVITLVRGLAQGIEALAGGREWVGNLGAGAVVLLAFPLLAGLFNGMAARRSAKQVRRRMAENRRAEARSDGEGGDGP